MFTPPPTTRRPRLGKDGQAAVAGGRLDGLAGVESGGQGGFLGAQPSPKGSRRVGCLGCLPGGLKPRSFQPRACHALPIREDARGALAAVVAVAARANGQDDLLACQLFLESGAGFKRPRRFAGEDHEAV